MHTHTPTRARARGPAHARQFRTHPFCKKHPLLMHIQYKYVFHASFSNRLLLFLGSHPSPGQAELRESLELQHLRFSAATEAEGPVSRGHFPLGPFRVTLVTCCPFSMVGMHSIRLHPGVRGRLKQHGVNMWPFHRSNEQFTQQIRFKWFNKITKSGDVSWHASFFWGIFFPSNWRLTAFYFVTDIRKMYILYKRWSV